MDYDFSRGYPTEKQNRTRTLQEYEKIRIATGLSQYGVDFRKSIIYLKNNDVKVPENFNKLLPAQKEVFLNGLKKKILESKDFLLD